MPEFKSPIGNKQFHGQPMRDIAVPDETDADQHQQPQMPQRPMRPGREHTQPVFDERELKQFGVQTGPTEVPSVREMTQVEMDILAAKKAKRQGKERLSDGARRRIEMLIGITRLTRDIEVGGQVYRLQTLKSIELRDAIVATAEFDGTVQLVFETRKQLLARSLVVVAGVEIDQFINSNDIQDRVNFIEELPHELLLRIYNEYIDLTTEAQEKYALKTVAEVKEVTEDLKK